MASFLSLRPHGGRCYRDTACKALVGESQAALADLVGPGRCPPPYACPRSDSCISTSSLRWLAAGCLLSWYLYDSALLLRQGAGQLEAVPGSGEWSLSLDQGDARVGQGSGLASIARMLATLCLSRRAITECLFSHWIGHRTRLQVRPSRSSVIPQRLRF